MVSIIENRADIEGTIVETSAGRIRDHCEVRVRLSRANNVGALVNLLTGRLGDLISIQIPLSAGKMEPGSVLHCRVRQTGPGVIVAEPDGCRSQPPDAQEPGSDDA